MIARILRISVVCRVRQMNFAQQLSICTIFRTAAHTTVQSVGVLHPHELASVLPNEILWLTESFRSVTPTETVSAFT
jgi:hypothetical protein